MIAQIRLWFAALTQRERYLVGTASVLTALVVGIFGILLPVVATLKRADTDLDEAVQRRGRIVALVEATQAKPAGTGAAASNDIGLLVTQSAAEKGFDLIKSANTTPGQISIRIDQARAPALLAWLSELEAQNVVVRGVTLRSGPNATVTVDAQLQMRAK